MNGLLAPAIALMNKLSYAKKFGVISITFFVPLLLLSYAIVNQTYEQIEKARAANESLEVVSDVLDLAQKTATFRDLAAVDAFYPRAILTEQVNTLEKGVFKAIDELQAKYPESPLSESLEKKRPRGRVL